MPQLILRITSHCFTSSSHLEVRCQSTRPRLGQIANMSYDPREHFQQIQRTIQQRGRGFGGLPGGGGAAGRGVLALVALGVGGVVLSNSIFNGKQASVIARFCTNPKQLTVVIERSNIRGCRVSKQTSTMKVRANPLQRLFSVEADRNRYSF